MAMPLAKDFNPQIIVTHALPILCPAIAFQINIFFEQNCREQTQRLDSGVPLANDLHLL